MDIEYDLKITVSVDVDKARILHGEKWLEALRESSDEFAQELNAFVDQHSFVKGCRMAKPPATDNQQPSISHA